MRYRAIRVSNVEDFLYKGIGDAIDLHPKWELHSIIPVNNIFLVILQTNEEVLSLEETVQRGEAAKAALKEK